MRLALLSLALLTGCGITPQEAQQRLPHLSDYQVCEGAILARAEIASMAQQEANRRGIQCRDYAQAIMQRQANQNQAVQNYVNTLQPQPYMIPPNQNRQTNCRSYRVGNTIQTDCN